MLSFVFIFKEYILFPNTLAYEHKVIDILIYTLKGPTKVITVSRKSILRQIIGNLGAVIRLEGIVKLD